MGRVQLFEFGDQTWLPEVFRRCMVEYLEATQAAGAFPDYVAARLAPVLERLGTRRLLDLCSGGAGPIPGVLTALADAHGMEVHASLSDLHPNPEAFERAKQASAGRVDYEAQPVDATAVPEDLEGLRTIFNGFHHFPPEVAQQVLRDASRSRHGIAIFELVERKLVSLIPFILVVPIVVVLLTPFVKPFRWSRLFWTYLLPVLPVLIVFDGIVSCLRAYSTEELQAMIDGIDAPGFRWDVRREAVPRLPGQRCVSLVGTPGA